MVVTESRVLKDHGGLRQGARNVREWRERVKQCENEQRHSREEEREMEGLAY